MSHSMGKLMDQKYRPMQSLEYLTDTKKRHERAQPVRLTQAFINLEHPESCRKATREKTQPVKVRELLKDLRSTNPSRKNSRLDIEEPSKLSVRRKLYNSPRIMENSILIAETNKSAMTRQKSIYVNNKNKSAGLNVFKVPVQKLKNNTTSRNQRKSMLLPPNSIKNRYTRMKNSLSLAPNIKATPTKTTSKIKTSEELGTVVEAPNSDELLINDTGFVQNTNNNKEVNPIVTAAVHSKAEDMNSNINPYNINLNSIINIDKQHLIRLQLYCQEAICVREKELTELKQMFALIQNILESEASKNITACLSTETKDTVSEKESDKLTTKESGDHHKDQKIEPLSEEVSAEEKCCIELTQNMTSEEYINSSQRIDLPRTMHEEKIVEKESETVEDMEQDKENFKTPSRSEKSIKKSEHFQQRRKSARLAAIEMKSKQEEIDNCNESKNGENAITISEANCILSSNQCTPDFSVSPNRKTLSRRKSKRHFTEYLALKSGISFLQTPDVKRLDDSVEEFGTPCIHAKNKTSSMSTKLLSELNLLYEDSPK